MMAGHLLFAATSTGYLLAGIAFEEHDLIQSLGDTYAAYRARGPALIPRPSLRRHSPRSWPKQGTAGEQATGRSCWHPASDHQRHQRGELRPAENRPATRQNGAPVTVAAGDLFAIETPGGGDYGA